MGEKQGTGRGVLLSRILRLLELEKPLLLLQEFVVLGLRRILLQHAAPARRRAALDRGLAITATGLLDGVLVFMIAKLLDFSGISPRSHLILRKYEITAAALLTANGTIR
jgi:hypothetical protein